MAKSIEFDVKVKVDPARGFDGLNVSAKDLQERMKDLDTQMKALIDTQGKAAYESASGIRIQRERKLALEELIATQEKEIDGTKRSTRGLGSLAASFIQSSTGASGFNREISILTTGLMGGVGLTAALAAAALGFKYLMDWIKSSKEEMEKFGGAVDTVISSFVKLQNSLTGFEFQIKPEQLDSLISKVDAKIQELEASRVIPLEERPKPGGDMRGAVLFTKKSLNEEDQKRLLTNEKMLESFKEMKTQLEAQKYLTELMAELDIKAVKTKEEKVKKEKELTKWSKGRYQTIMTGQFSEGGVDPSAMQFNTGMLGGSDFSREQLEAMRRARDEQKAMALENEKLMNSFIMSSANVFRSEMSGAWQSIFGEANSIFEKLIASWADLMFARLGTSLFTSFFGGGGGLGDLLGFSRSVSAGAGTAETYRVGG